MPCFEFIPGNPELLLYTFLDFTGKLEETDKTVNENACRLKIRKLVNEESIRGTVTRRMTNTFIGMLESDVKVARENDMSDNEPNKKKAYIAIIYCTLHPLSYRHVKRKHSQLYFYTKIHIEID